MAQGFQPQESLFRALLEKFGLHWGKYVDVYPRKLLMHFLAMPYNDVLGVFNKVSNTLADILFGGNGFKIKVTKGMPNYGGNMMAQVGKPMEVPAGTQAVQDFIDDHLFGICALRENLRRHFTTFLIYGNMSTQVGRSAKGVEVRFIDGLSSFPLDCDETCVDRLANISFKTIDSDKAYAIVTLDGLALRQIQVFQVSSHNIIGRVSWGSPEWLNVFDGTNPDEESMLPMVELGHKKSQWWRLPTEDVMHRNTPYTSGVINNIPAYRELLKSYLQWKKEIGWKQTVLFYNKNFEEPEFQKWGVMNSFADLKKSNIPVMFTNPNSTQNSTEPLGTGGFTPQGFYPNSAAFPDFTALWNGLNTNYSPINGLNGKEQECVYKTQMAKDKLIEVFDAPIRQDYMQQMNWEISKFTSIHRLGKSLLIPEAEPTQTAAQTIMGDRDLLNFVKQLEAYSERPLKELVLAALDYAVEDGLINVADVPTRMSEIEIIWDNSFLMDDQVEKQRMLSVMGSALSVPYINRHVFHMSNEEILQNYIELMGDPMMGLQMKNENDQLAHMKEGQFGYLGRSYEKPVGKDSDGQAKQANRGEGTQANKQTGGVKD